MTKSFITGVLLAVFLVAVRVSAPTFAASYVGVEVSRSGSKVIPAAPCAKAPAGCAVEPGPRS